MSVDKRSQSRFVTSGPKKTGSLSTQHGLNSSAKMQSLPAGIKANQKRGTPISIPSVDTGGLYGRQGAPRKQSQSQQKHEQQRQQHKRPTPVLSSSIHTDLFANSSKKQPSKYTPDSVYTKRVETKKKPEILVKNSRKRPTTDHTIDSSTKKLPRLDDATKLSLITDNQLHLTKCPYCHEVLLDTTSSDTLPTVVQDALNQIQQADQQYSKERLENDDQHNLPKRRYVHNMDQFRFCQLHILELKVKPEGKKKGYPVNIAFDGLVSRVEALRSDLLLIINGETSSHFKNIVLEAYQLMGRHKARSTVGVMTRFEKTLPGYYGPKGGAIIFKTLNDMFLHTGILTKQKVKPQLPLEFVQQVLVPETALRLIQEDLLKEDKTLVDSRSKAMTTLTESSDFGSKMYPLEDEELSHFRKDDNDDESSNASDNEHECDDSDSESGEIESENEV